VTDRNLSGSLTGSLIAYLTLTNQQAKRFFHFAHDQSNVDAIVQHGFDLNMFGHTGKKFNMPDH
jgi:hypothetical protein